MFLSFFSAAPSAAASFYTHFPISLPDIQYWVFLENLKSVLKVRIMVNEFELNLVAHHGFITMDQ